MHTTRTRTSLAALATLGLLAVPVAASVSADANGSTAASTVRAASSGNGPITPEASVPALTGSDTKITVDQGFVDALNQLGLKPGTVGKAKFDGKAFTFPITGGNASLFKKGVVRPYVIGQVQHEGSGLSLSAGGTTVKLENFNIDPGASKVYGDVYVGKKLAVASAPLFFADGRTLQAPKVDGSTLTLDGTEVKLTGAAADLLNSTFKTKAVKAGLLVGTATITVDLPQ